MPTFRLFTVVVLPVVLAACGGGVDRVTEQQCPSVGVLATADSWQSGAVTAQLQTAQLSCFISRNDDNLLAEVSVDGRISAAGVPLNMFVAALNEKGEVTARTQLRVTPGTEAFSYKLPRIAYGRKGTETVKARLVVGFVLTDAQLQANRAEYRKKLGL